MIRHLFAAALACAFSSSLGAQALAAPRYPNVDEPMALGPSESVRILNRIVVDRAPGQRGARIDVQYSTSIPAENAAGRGEQADRLAQVIGAEAWKMGARSITIAICDTRA